MSQTTFSDGIGYEGKVTLTLKNNNHVLSSKTYKNRGTAQLFKFLGYCLIDSYEEAKNLLPNKIMLLQNTSPNKLAPNPRTVIPRTTWQTLAKMPAIISTNGQVKVVYSFEIAQAAIEDNFNQVALYGALVNDPQDFSAYYFLKDARGELESQNVSEWSPSAILLIEWELSLSNQGDGVNND